MLTTLGDATLRAALVILNSNPWNLDAARYPITARIGSVMKISRQPRDDRGEDSCNMIQFAGKKPEKAQEMVAVELALAGLTWHKMKDSVRSTRVKF